MSTWRDASYAVVDLETTGLDSGSCEILSVGIVHVDAGLIPADSAFYSLVRPSRLPERETIVVHGIRPVDLRDAPDPDVVAPGVIDALAGREVIAHVAHIEEDFLSCWLRPHGFALPRTLIDTDILTRLYLLRSRGMELPGHVGLGAAADLFGLPEQSRHHALGDALTTAQLFLALATNLSPGGADLDELKSAHRTLAREQRSRKLRGIGRRLTQFTTPQKKEEKT